MKVTRAREVNEVIERIRKKMRLWGVTVTFLARQLGVSRQYAWQIVHYRTFLSLDRVHTIEAVLDTVIQEQVHVRTFGDRLRAARVSAGLTLKQVGRMIGYTWVGVQRWEKNVCVPKPGVLWHLLSLYGVADEWTRSGLMPAVNRLTPPGNHAMSSLPHRMQIHAELAEALRDDAVAAARA